MDGKGTGNAAIYLSEAVWKTLKYEDVYFERSIQKDGIDLYQGLKSICFYNQEQLHQSLDYKTPHTNISLAA
jgi:putative transposase